MTEQLLRSEVMEAKNQSWLGGVRLASPVSQTISTAAALLFGITIILWLCLAHYTRRERVSGSLVPDAGLIEVTARSNAVIQEIFVSEGNNVRIGDPLLSLSGERINNELGQTSAAVSASLREQIASLNAAIRRAKEVDDDHRLDLNNQKAVLQAELEQLSYQRISTAKQLAKLEDMLARIEPLLSKGYISALQVQQQETQAFETEIQLKSLTRQGMDIAQQIESIDHQLAQLPLLTQNKIGELQRQIGQVQQSLAQNEAERSTVLQATQAGVVSSLLSKPGQSVAAGQPILAIVPEKSSLQAHLLVPSKAAGLIRIGMPVFLRYQPFPHQKYGVQRGVVSSISHSSIKPSQVSLLLGQQTAPQEPTYLVRVSIDRQDINVDGDRITLKPGMMLDADLLLESRSMAEWIFDPIYEIKRRMDLKS